MCHIRSKMKDSPLLDECKSRNENGEKWVLNINETIKIYTYIYVYTRRGGEKIMHSTLLTTRRSVAKMLTKYARAALQNVK